MPLLTDAIRNALPALYATEQTPLAEKQILCKFFDPCSAWTWYAVEGGEDEGEFLFWGLVRGHEDEWGYFSLAELESLRGRVGLPIERDRYFTPCAVGELPDAEILATDSFEAAP
jgi:hypothetical protein